MTMISIFLLAIKMMTNGDDSDDSNNGSVAITCVCFVRPYRDCVRTCDVIIP